MSIIGQSFSGDRAGAWVDFAPGSAGLANLFTQGYTVACLAKISSSNWGMFGGYSDTAGGTSVRQVFISNNSGARMFGDGDFTAGYPDPGVDADGINDNVWRWHVFSKPTGATHYRMHYADLATLTWSHGESVSAGNHSDNATPAAAFSTWAIYAMGFDSGGMAALVAWPSSLSDANIEASCTLAASALSGTVAPVAGWLFPEATSGSAVSDFTGGGANETARQFIATSADPPGFNFALSGANKGSQMLLFF